MTAIQNFIEQLKGDEIHVEHSTCETSVVILHNLGKFQLEFLLHYEVEIQNYISATYEQPEECDFVFHNRKHEDIALYEGAEMIEISDEELHQIDIIIHNLLY